MTTTICRGGANLYIGGTEQPPHRRIRLTTLLPLLVPLNFVKLVQTWQCCQKTNLGVAKYGKIWAGTKTCRG
jgi:hypothetical protein